MVSSFLEEGISQQMTRSRRGDASATSEGLREPERGRRLAEVRVAWTQSGAAGATSVAVPEGSRDVQVHLERGVATRRTEGVVRVMWRTAEGKLCRRAIALPAGARDVAEEYVYRRDAPRSEAEAEGPSCGAEAAPPGTKPRWDISGIARSWGLDRLPREGWASRCDDLGIPLRRLGPLLRSGLRKLGEGTYASVFAVERGGRPELVVKRFRDRGGFHYQEAENLLLLDGVPGLPKLVALCPRPPALLMTYHGERDLFAYFVAAFDLDEYLLILYKLCNILNSLHKEGFAHNDLKGNNVMLDVIEGRTTVTLIDLGTASALAACPYRRQAGKDGAPLERERAAKYEHLAPEVFRGGPASPAADVFSLGVLMGVARDMAAHETVPQVDRLIAACTARRAERRPSCAEVMMQLLLALFQREQRWK